MSKKKFVKRSEAAKDELIHGPFSPLEVRRGERILCTIKPLRGDSRRTLPIWRMSPLGVELVDDKATASSDVWAENSKLFLTITLGSQVLHYRGYLAAIEEQDKGELLLRIRFDDQKKIEQAGEARAHKERHRWRCHKLFFPTGVAKNEVRFNDKIFFRVIDISAGGMRLITSLRNKYLSLGLEIYTDLYVPFSGKCRCTLKITSMDVRQDADGPYQSLGVQFVAPSKQVLSYLGQYILQFGSGGAVMPSPRVLMKQGFYVHSVTDAIDYGVVNDEKTYQEVLELRAQAFRGVAGLGVTCDASEMADDYDDRSRILVCRYRNKVIATARLCFHGPSDRLEEEDYIDLPFGFPSREQVVEASRVATDPDFRGNDLFLNILRYIMLTTLQSGRRWIVMSTYTKLAPVYKRVSFRELGVLRPHPKFPGAKLHLMLGDCQAVLEGRIGNPLLWNTLVPDIQKLIALNENVKLSWVARKRLAFYQMLTPVYKLYERKQVERRMKRQDNRRDSV